MKNNIERKAFIMILVFAILLAVVLIFLYVSAGATLLPEYSEVEPWEENIEYYISKYGDRPTDRPIDLVYFGYCKITHYCACSQCCGKSDGITASGAPACEGWTVANGCLPFGTLIQINGHTYCVEDRGVGDMTIDVFVSDHQRALELGVYWAEVWIVRN